MKTNLIRDMLLIEDPSVFKLYTELNSIAKYFVPSLFILAVIGAFFSDFDMMAPVKKLIIVAVFMAGFYQFHTVAVSTALETASLTLQKVSPRNLFVKKWYEPKVRTAENISWNFLDRFAVPNLNDLLASGLFVISKAFIWLLKLIYSTVYHLTYVFSGITAVLYFLGWTQDALKGTVQASIWCMILPFVVVAVLALVGNSFTEGAEHGALAVSSIDNLIWLFGVTLLLLITPLITFGMIKGDGVHSFGSKMGSMVVSSGIKAMAFSPMLAGGIKNATYGLSRVGSKTLMEPSIKELLQKENTPDQSKMKLLDKKGGIKSPFSTGRTLDKRLNAVGMTKDEALTLSKMPAAQAQNNGSAPMFKKASNSNSGNRPSKREKQSFQFDKKYWDSITPEHREGIKKKYGVDGNNLSKNKIHYPVNSGRPSVTVSTPGKMTEAPKSRPNTQQIGPKQKRGRYEV